MTKSLPITKIIILLISVCQTFGDNNPNNNCSNSSCHLKTTSTEITEKMEYKVEALKHTVADLGEGPHWDIETQSLYFVDINNARIYRYDYNEDKIYDAKIENAKYASFIIPLADSVNQFAVGIDRRVVNIEWDGRSSECKLIGNLFEVESDNEKFEGNRFNDAKADPMGRFYGGTMPSNLLEDVFQTKRSGNLYRHEKHLPKPILLKDNVTISNGLAWNTKTNKFYYIDSVDVEVKEYDYDIQTGEIKNPKVLTDFRVKAGEKQNFLPDGMTIDSEGFLYVATYGLGKVLKINPLNGNIIMEITLPCEQITSAAFGGPNLDILYVTTAAAGNKPSPAGQTFRITGLNAKGLAMNKLKF